MSVAGGEPASCWPPQPAPARLLYAGTVLCCTSQRCSAMVATHNACGTQKPCSTQQPRPPAPLSAGPSLEQSVELGGCCCQACMFWPRVKGQQGAIAARHQIELADWHRGLGDGAVAMVEHACRRGRRGGGALVNAPAAEGWLVGRPSGPAHATGRGAQHMPWWLLQRPQK